MDNKDTSGVLLPPPIVYVVFLGAAYTAEYYYPLPFIAESISLVTGIIVIILSLILFGLVLREFSNFNTSVDHRKTTTDIITSGAFKYSRNPIYVSMVLLCIGLTLVVNSLWGFITTFLASVVVTQFIILKEEVYLENKFGDKYISYRQSVRRWL